MRSEIEVGAVVRARRIALGYSTVALAVERAAGDVSAQTWRKIEAGTAAVKIRPQTEIGVARSLGWYPDWRPRLLAGEPEVAVRAPVDEAVPAVSSLPDWYPEIARLWRAVVELAAHAGVDLAVLHDRPGEPPAAASRG